MEGIQHGGETVICVIAHQGPEHDDLVAVLKHLHLPLESYYDAQSFLCRPDCARIGCLVADTEDIGLSHEAFLAALARRDLARSTILLTSHCDLGEAVSAIKAGVADYIERPLPDRRLLARARDIAASHGVPGVGPAH